MVASQQESECLEALPRVWQRLVAEEGAQVAVARCARSSLRPRRAPLEHTREPDVAIRQERAPAVEGEVDVSEFDATVRGVVVLVWLFILRLRVRAGVRVRLRASDAVGVFDGHGRAFAWFRRGARRVRYGTPNRRSCGCCAAGSPTDQALNQSTMHSKGAALAHEDQREVR